MTGPAAPTADADADALRRDANARAAARDWPAAAAAFAALAARQPHDASAWIGAAKAYDLAGHPRASHAAALAAQAAGPASWPHALALARLLRQWHEVPALRALADAMQAWRDEAPVHEWVELADLLGREDAHDAALAWLDAALAIDPDLAPAIYLRGTTRLFLGRMHAARADLERAVAIAPHFAHAHWRLTELRAGDPAGAPARVARLREERGKVALGSEHDIHFSYALHAELHDLGEFDAAWEALARGARGKRATLRYDAATDRALMDAIAATCDAGFIAGPGHAGGDDEPTPIFIIGLFRSGTTLLERLLAGHPAIADGGESAGFFARLRLAADHAGPLSPAFLQAAGALDFPALGADFMASQRWRARGRPVWTEKLPSNFLMAGLIARALPRARFVHLRRPPMDVCFSNLRTLYGPIGAYSYDQAEMASYHQAYVRLMAHWREVLGARLLDVDHAALVAQPEAEMRRVLAHAGLEFDARVLDLGARAGAVSTASAAQVRGGIRVPSQPAWWPYRDALRPMAEALGADI